MASAIASQLIAWAACTAARHRRAAASKPQPAHAQTLNRAAWSNSARDDLSGDYYAHRDRSDAIFGTGESQGRGILAKLL